MSVLQKRKYSMNSFLVDADSGRISYGLSTKRCFLDESDMAYRNEKESPFHLDTFR